MFPNRGDTWTEQTVLNIWSDAYSPDNTDGKYPRVGGTGSKGANGQASSFWLMNGNYFRCKNIELGYTLPKQWVNSIGVDRCRVYVSGTNLFCIRPHRHLRSRKTAVTVELISIR